MTDDLDSAEHSTENDEGKDSRNADKSKRGRLKDAINRTKSKIAERVREEKEARKLANHTEKKESPGRLDDDVDAFLAAGRVSTASSTRPSIYSDTASNENLSAPNVNGVSISSRPSTSDSKSQPSPRRIIVPRIDVSASQRFPNAKEVGTNVHPDQPGSSAVSSASHGSSALLRPVFKSKNQSTSSIASAERKKRIRGLSVGFADAPPVIIGEGGEEAEAPPVEISKAKMRRARSASPQARSPYPGARNDAGGQVTDRRRDAPIDVFNPRSGGGVQTGALPSTMKPSGVPDTGYDDFVPKPFSRTQTGFSSSSGSSIVENPPALMPMQKQEFLPSDLGRTQKGTLDLTREFELSLGLKPSSPSTKAGPESQQPRIFAPKPKRAAPSYDLIEGGGHQQRVDLNSDHPAQEMSQRDTQQLAAHVSPPQQFPAVQQTPNQGVHEQLSLNATQQPTQLNPPHPQQTQHFELRQGQPSVTFSKKSSQPPVHQPIPQTLSSEQHFNHPVQQSVIYQQPPTSGISRFASLHASHGRPMERSPRQESLPQQQPHQVPAEPTRSTSRVLSPIVTNNDQQNYRSFVDRAHPDSHPPSFVDSPASGTPQSGNVRRMSPSAPYETSPNNLSSGMTSPHSAAEHSGAKMRFYEGINQGKPPSGFI